jgi:hypothetical protein
LREAGRYLAMSMRISPLAAPKILFRDTLRRVSGTG